MARTMKLLLLTVALLGGCSDDKTATPDTSTTLDGSTPDGGAIPDTGAAPDTKPAADTTPTPDAAQTGTLTVSYVLNGPAGKVSCAEGQALWVDLFILDGGTEVASKIDQPCDDKPVAFDDLPFGTYTIGVTAWDQELYDGMVEGHVFSATSGASVEVPLTHVPK